MKTKNGHGQREGSGAERLLPVYQTPLIVPLGDLAAGAGLCRVGSADTSQCRTGGAASGAQCRAGGAAGQQCRAGMGASHCGAGSAVVG